MAEPYTLLVMSDSHSGDVAGLTEPGQGHDRWHWWQGKMWDWWKRQLQDIGHVDVVLHIGELLEGPGKKSTLELFLPDMDDQAEHAAQILNMVGADAYRLCYASKYHAGRETRHERRVVKELRSMGHDASIGKHQRFELHGVKFDGAHKVGGSRTAYAQGTQLGKGAVIDIIRQYYNGKHKADFYFRGHNHYFYFVGNDWYTIYNTPSLKWPLGEYGVEIDSPFYTVGILKVKVSPGGHVDVDPRILHANLPETDYEVFHKPERTE